MKIKFFLFIFISILFAKMPLNAEPVAEDSEKVDFASGLFSRQMYDMAKNEYKNILKNYPNSSRLEEVYYGLGESCFFTGNYKEAIHYYDLLLKNYPESKRYLFAKLRMGEAHFFLNDPTKAIDYFKSLLASSDLTDDLRQGGQYYLAKAYIEIGEDSNAAPLFEDIFDNGDTEYYVFTTFELGAIAFRQKKYSKAQEYFRLTLESKASEELKSRAEYGIAQSFLALDDTEKALIRFRALMDNRQNQELKNSSYINALHILLKVNRDDDLIECYSLYRDTIGDHEVAYRADMLAAEAHYRLNQSEKCYQILDIMLKDDSIKPKQRCAAQEKYIEFLMYDGMREDALERALQFEKNPECSSLMPNIIYLKGELYYELQNYEEAIKFYQDIVNNYPESNFFDNSLYSMAYARMKLNNRETARKLFFEFYNRNMEGEGGKDALSNIILLDMAMGNDKYLADDMAIFQKKFSKDQAYVDMLLRIAQYHSSKKNNHDAVQVYEKILMAHEAFEYNRDEILFRVGFNYQELGEYEKAIQSYARISENNNLDSYYYAGLKNSAYNYYKLEDDEKAAQIYYRIISSMPKNDLGINNYIWLVQYFIDQDDVEKVSVIARRIRNDFKENPAHHVGLYYEAEANFRLESYVEARQRYSDYIDSGHREFLGLALFGRGLCDVKQGMLDGAAENFEAALHLEGQDVALSMRSRFELARVEELRNNAAKAAKLYMMVAILYNNEEFVSEALYRAGMNFEKSGDLVNRDKTFQELIERYPENIFAGKVQSKTSKDE